MRLRENKISTGNRKKYHICEEGKKKEKEIKKCNSRWRWRCRKARERSAYLARVNTAFAFFSLSPSHLFSMVEASTVKKVAPPCMCMEYN